MNLNRLRLITFDVTDTLLKLRYASGHQYGEVGIVHGVSCDPNLLSYNYKLNWIRMTRHHPNYGLKTGLGWKNWWKHLVYGTFKDAKIHLDKDKLDLITARLIDVYKTSECWQHCPGVLSLLTFLRSKEIPLGVISNFDPSLNATLRNTDIRHYFSFVVTSYEVGVEKPDPRIFQEAMQRADMKGLRPNQCLHIGDMAHLDYLGAVRSGWNGFLIGKAEEDPCDVAMNSEHVFSSLFHVQRHFEKQEVAYSHSSYDFVVQ